MKSIYEQMNLIDDSASLNYRRTSLLENTTEQPKKKKLSKNDIIFKYNFGMPMSEEDIAKIGTVEQHQENAKRIKDAVTAIKKWDPEIRVTRKKDWTSITLFLRRGAKGGLTKEEITELTNVITNATGYKDFKVYGADNYYRCDGFISIDPEVKNLKESLKERFDDYDEDEMEDRGAEFYERAAYKLNKHFNCTGAFLEPSTQTGHGRTFLFADDMKFEGSFDYETGEGYIEDDDFEGFLNLCLKSFKPAMQKSVKEGLSNSKAKKRR